MMERRRLTTRYTMREGNRIIKYGITDNPNSREGQNRRAGLGDKLRREGPIVTRKSAKLWESSSISSYKRRNGRLPPGNKIH